MSGVITPDMVRASPTLARAATPRLTPYIPHRPTPRQAAFLLLRAEEAFYGGAAGGGKSVGLLMGALQFVDQAGYAAVIVRQSFAQLAQPGGLMARAEEWLAPTDACWNGTDHQWRFPSGATLTFRHLQDSGAERTFQGEEYQFIGIDEVTDLTEDQYRFLFSRLRRRTAQAVPLRMRAASNPYGPGQEWVHRWFILEGRAHGRVFIPARLEDNPHLDRESYERSLKRLGPTTYRQLRHGDWTVRPEGGVFRRSWFDERFVDREEVPPEATLCRYWDLAATEPRKGTDPDYTASVLLARTRDGTYYVVDVRRARSSPHAVEQLVRSTAAQDEHWASARGQSPPAVRMEQEPGSAGVAVIDHYRRDVLPRSDFAGVRSTGAKEIRVAPVAARVEAGDVRVCRGGWNTAFLDEVCDFPQGRHDDQVDALSGAFDHLARAADTVPVVGPATIDEPSYWRGADGTWSW